VRESGRRLFVIMPWRNLGASGPWRDIKRRVVSLAAPAVGGGGGGLVGWEEYGRDRWYLVYLLQVLLSRMELRGVYIVGC
jgi:hypothetical protein